MTTLASLNATAAKHDPASVFACPLAIVDEILLTRGEKIATLERWRSGILQQLAAADDGMRTVGMSVRHADTLADIELALCTLKETSSTPS
ncbi:MAG: hypothetical protein ABL898_01185 [Hyphomicrobiaceae bacterium]|nr:hypothetical protein [Hyphomicrobiaceae bacterium]